MNTDHSKVELVARTSAFVRAHNIQFGGKVNMLATLEDRGYRVPAFMALTKGDTYAIAHGAYDDETLRLLSEDIHRVISAQTYAVRSGAFAEDTADSSHAGEFMTLLDLPPYEVGGAIKEVITDAVRRGYATKNRPFSVIVQEYISPDHAGVLFTRDPRIARETVIEWRRGRGAEVVGGARVASVYRNSDAFPHIEHFPGEHEVFRIGRAIEREVGSAQDIEWAVKGGIVYVLQSRPVKHVNKEMLEMFQLIDKQFADARVYHLSRSGVGESFASCTPLALSLLKYLHREGGPIAHAYRSLGVTYRNEDAFVPLYGALYVDHLRELWQFFPALDYVPTPHGFTPRLVRWRGLLVTILNIFHLARLRTPDSKTLHHRLSRAAQRLSLTSKKGIRTQTEALQFFDEIYPDIFLTNLYTEKVFRRATHALAHVPFPLATLLTLPISGHANSRASGPRQASSPSLLGNSLNVSDRSAYIPSVFTKTPDKELMQWWGSASKRLRRRVEREVSRAQQFELLREEGRHLTVHLVSLLRVLCEGSFGQLSDYATLDELMGSDITIEVLEARREHFAQEVRRDAPFFIATIPPRMQTTRVGVSSGVASGQIATRESLGKYPHAILLVERLSPEIAEFLTENGSHVVGIIASEGGLLSHMAIIARERGIPVVVDPDVARRFHSGMRVSIDGGSGQIVLEQ